VAEANSSSDLKWSFQEDTGRVVARIADTGELFCLDASDFNQPLVLQRCADTIMGNAAYSWVSPSKRFAYNARAALLMQSDLCVFVVEEESTFKLRLETCSTTQRSVRSRNLSFVSQSGAFVVKGGVTGTELFVRPASTQWRNRGGIQSTPAPAVALGMWEGTLDPKNYYMVLNDVGSTMTMDIQLTSCPLPGTTVNIRPANSVFNLISPIGESDLTFTEDDCETGLLSVANARIEEWAGRGTYGQAQPRKLPRPRRYQFVSKGSIDSVGERNRSSINDAGSTMPPGIQAAVALSVTQDNAQVENSASSILVPPSATQLSNVMDVAFAQPFDNADMGVTVKQLQVKPTCTVGSNYWEACHAGNRDKLPVLPIVAEFGLFKPEVVNKTETIAQWQVARVDSGCVCGSPASPNAWPTDTKGKYASNEDKCMVTPSTPPTQPLRKVQVDYINQKNAYYALSLEEGTVQGDLLVPTPNDAVGVALAEPGLLVEFNLSVKGPWPVESIRADSHMHEPGPVPTVEFQKYKCAFTNAPEVSFEPIESQSFDCGTPYPNPNTDTYTFSPGTGYAFGQCPLTEWGTKYSPAMNISVLTVEGVMSCCTKCQEEQDCRAFTFVSNSAQNPIDTGECFLWPDAADPSPTGDLRYISGTAKPTSASDTTDLQCSVPSDHGVVVTSDSMQVQKVQCTTPCVLKGYTYTKTVQQYAREFAVDVVKDSYSYLQCCDQCRKHSSCISWTWVGQPPPGVYSYYDSLRHKNTCMLFGRKPGYAGKLRPLTAQAMTYASQRSQLFSESAYWWQSGTQGCCPRQSAGDRLVIRWTASARTDNSNIERVKIPYALPWYAEPLSNPWTGPQAPTDVASTIAINTTFGVSKTSTPYILKGYEPLYNIAGSQALENRCHDPSECLLACIDNAECAGYQRVAGTAFEDASQRKGYVLSRSVPHQTNNFEWCQVVWSMTPSMITRTNSFQQLWTPVACDPKTTGKACDIQWYNASILPNRVLTGTRFVPKGWHKKNTNSDAQEVCEKSESCVAYSYNPLTPANQTVFLTRATGTKVAPRRYGGDWSSFFQARVQLSVRESSH
jgi:hypothetical protein